MPKYIADIVYERRVTVEFEAADYPAARSFLKKAVAHNGIEEFVTSQVGCKTLKEIHLCTRKVETLKDVSNQT